MQGIGHIFDKKNIKILVLVRQSKFTRHFKIRKSGKDGVHFTDEELYLNEHLDKMNELKHGKCVAL